MEWAGRYHALVEEIIFMANGYSGIRSREIFQTDPPCSPEQIQVLQYLLAHEEEQQNMKSIADMLGMTKSAFTKLIAGLEGNGLIDKYHTQSNRKNIVLRVSEEGRALYDQYVELYGRRIFGSFFDMGNGLSDKALERVTAMIHELNQNYSFQKANEVSLKEPLIKVERPNR